MKVILWENPADGHLFITWPIETTVWPWERYLHPAGDFVLEGESEEMYLDRIAMNLLVAEQRSTEPGAYLPLGVRRLPNIHPTELPQSRRLRMAWRYRDGRVVVDDELAKEIRYAEKRQEKIQAFLDGVGQLTFEEMLACDVDSDAASRGAQCQPAFGF